MSTKDDSDGDNEQQGVKPDRLTWEWATKEG